MYLCFFFSNNSLPCPHTSQVSSPRSFVLQHVWVFVGTFSGLGCPRNAPHADSVHPSDGKRTPKSLERHEPVLGARPAQKEALQSTPQGSGGRELTCLQRGDAAHHKPYKARSRAGGRNEMYKNQLVHHWTQQPQQHDAPSGLGESTREIPGRRGRRRDGSGWTGSRQKGVLRAQARTEIQKEETENGTNTAKIKEVGQTTDTCIYIYIYIYRNINVCKRKHVVGSLETMTNV